MPWSWSIATARSRPADGPPIVHGRRRTGWARCTACPSPSRRRSTSRGCRTTSSHPPLKDNVAAEDASLVARLRAAGAVILGKTNVPELCADFQTDSPLFGTHEERLGRPAHGRRLDRRRRGRRRGAPVAARARQRHRRLGPQSRALQRHLFAETDRVARARPRPCAEPAGPDPHRPLDGRVRPLGALGRGSRDGAAHHRRTRRLRRRGRTRAAGACAGRQAEGPAHRVHRQQSAGQGLGRHRFRRAADGAPAEQGRRQGEARRAQGDRLAAGLGRLGRSLPVPGARSAAAGRARAHLREGQCVRSDGALGRPHGAARPRRVLGRARPARPDHAAVRVLPRRLRRLADAGDAGRRLHPAEAERAAGDRRHAASVFLCRHVLQFPRQPDGPAVDRAALRLLQGRPADRPAAHRQEVGRRQAAGRRQGAGEAPAALSRAAELRDCRQPAVMAGIPDRRRLVWRRTIPGDRSSAAIDRR